MSAGSGILHSEENVPASDPSGRAGTEPPRPVHFVQMWVAPDEPGTQPEYEQLDITRELDGGGLVTVASGMDRHRHARATGIRQRHAALHAARMAPGGSVALPPAPYVHLYVAKGAVVLEGAGALGTGDAARLRAADGQRVRASADGAEVLVWEMHADRPGR